MSTMTYVPPLATPGRTERAGIVRLVAVEMRKMVDTRAGRWLLAVLGVISLAVVVIGVIVGTRADRTFSNFFQFILLPVAVLLPVLGILSVTGEWSQRTTLTTFTLVPGRHRVLVAKLLAVTVYALLSVLTSVLLAAAGNLAVVGLDRGDGSWTLKASLLGGGALAQVIGVVMGVAFGMLLMNSALAIVLYFLLPTIWSVLIGLIPAIREPAGWLDLNQTQEPLFEAAMTADSWARLGTSVALWVLLPLVLGAFRLARTELA